MAIDGELLKKAQATAGSLAEAERQALLARADHHTTIRRLHLAGGTCREIGQALGLSHQRVQQIVDAAGGTWWGRLWRSRNRRDAVCTFCGLPPAEVAKLIAGPDVYICDACVAAAEAALAGNGATAGLALAGNRARAKCSFCSKRQATGRRVAVAPSAAVCADCVAVCRQILADRGA
ncbi:MAG TPA: ClpX C4-type zinc finger protein [Thermoanaerobaculia bacterium]|jgi:hypothetical protein|nr:ClpX C4-type zinc finger protein [Thermoanaerobaculia bacterium]